MSTTEHTTYFFLINPVAVILIHLSRNEHDKRSWGMQHTTCPEHITKLRCESRPIFHIDSVVLAMCLTFPCVQHRKN